MNRSTPRRAVALTTGLGTLLSTALLFAAPATAAPQDSDRDGMPDRWEKRHGLRPFHKDARLNLDRDGLRNIAEFRRGTLPEVEDTDRDGMDDGDEVYDDRRSTDVDDPDTDDDGTEDGDEDADHDGTDNEDEDDSDENCGADDDDADSDDVSDEDENEQRTKWRDSDSDDDGDEDGDEDSDEDGESNEDEDDTDDDSCDGDEDGDGEDDEDGDDVLGTITGYDASSWTLTVQTVTGSTLALVLTEDTEVEWEDHSGPGGGDATVEDLQAGVEVAEVDVDDDTGTVEEIELVGNAHGDGGDDEDDDEDDDEMRSRR